MVHTKYLLVYCFSKLPTNGWCSRRESRESQPESVSDEYHVYAVVNYELLVHGDEIDGSLSQSQFRMYTMYIIYTMYVLYTAVLVRYSHAIVNGEKRTAKAEVRCLVDCVYMCVCVCWRTFSLVACLCAQLQLPRSHTQNYAVL